MIIVDSCGWLEWFTDGTLADSYKKYLAHPDNLLVPAIVLYEVYKVLKREAGEEKALLAAGYMQGSRLIPLDDTIALAAADIALQKNLAMADAIIVAVAKAHNCRIISSDADLKGLDNVDYIQGNWGQTPIFSLLGLPAALAAALLLLRAAISS